MPNICSSNCPQVPLHLLTDREAPECRPMGVCWAVPHWQYSNETLGSLLWPELGNNQPWNYMKTSNCCLCLFLDEKKKKKLQLLVGKYARGNEQSYTCNFFTTAITLFKMTCLWNKSKPPTGQSARDYMLSEINYVKKVKKIYIKALPTTCADNVVFRRRRSAIMNGRVYVFHKVMAAV